MIGVIGDHDPKNPTHLATDAALEDLGVPFEWIATDEVRARWDEIEGLLGMFIAPSTPYRDTEGALEAIRHVREVRRAAGWHLRWLQQIVLEHVHNVLGLRNAEHQELAPDAPVLAVTALAAPDQPGHDLRLEY